MFSIFKLLWKYLLSINFSLKIKKMKCSILNRHNTYIEMLRLCHSLIYEIMFSEIKG